VVNTAAWFRVEPVQWIIMNWANLPRRINPNGLVSGYDNHKELLSLDIIANGIAFNETWDSIGFAAAWENSQIRTFLNETMYLEMFSEAEQARMPWRDDMPNNDPMTASWTDSDWLTPGEDGRPTRDRLWLPTSGDIFGPNSIMRGTGTETEMDWSGNLIRMASPSDFAVAHRANMWTAGQGPTRVGTQSWWLRSAIDFSAMRGVSANGTASSPAPTDGSIGVRPALRLSIT